MTSIIDDPDLLAVESPVDASLLVELEEAFAQEAQPDGRVGDDERSARRTRTYLQAVVLSAPIVVLAVLAWTHFNLFADGYIYLHVVQNIMAGHGPVFNEGQRVEATTSPAWTIILAVVGLTTRLPLTWVAVVLGIVLSVGGTAIALASSGQLVRRSDPGRFLLPLGTVLFIALPPIWSLASTGLEDGLIVFWLASCLAVMVRWSRTEHEPIPRLGLVVLGLGFLVRPELMIESSVFVAVVLWGDRGSPARRGGLRIITWAAAVPLVYEIFRMGYYGMLFSNTAITKEAALLSPGRGIHYFSDFVGPYWLFIAVGALLIGAYYPIASALHRRPEYKRSHVSLLAFPIAGALNAGYIIMVGGDYIHARLLIAPLFAFCAPVSVVPVARRNVVALLIVPWAIVCALWFRTNDNSPWSIPSIVSVDGHGSMASPSPSPAAVAAIRDSGSTVYVQFSGPTSITRLDGSVAPSERPTLATSWIGPVSYELGPGVQIVDLLGLADPLTSHMRLVKRGQVAGHEKPLPTPWIAALLTPKGASTAQLDSLERQRPSYFTPLIRTASGHKLSVQTAWARAALQCPVIKDLRSSSSAPLTVGSFLSNIYHSISRTIIRIPADPEAAYHAYCGPGTPNQVRAVIDGM